MTTNRSRLLFFTLALTLALATAARAQEAGPGGKAATQAMNGFSILNTPEAVADLGLKPEQSTRLRKLQKDLMAAQEEKQQPLEGVSREESLKQNEPIWQEFATNANKGLAEILNPAQLKRYRQIMLQVLGYSAFGDAEVQDALKMTDEQKATYRQIRDDFGKKVDEIRQSTTNARTAAASQLKAAREKADADAISLLTDDQKTAWSDLVGKEFKRAQGAGTGLMAAASARNGLNLLTVSGEARADVDLTPEQISKLRELAKELQAVVTEKLRPIEGLPREERLAKAEPIQQEFATNANTGIAKILHTGQLKRYHQIMLQMKGYSAFLEPEIQDALKLTREQERKLQQLRAETSRHLHEIEQATKDDRAAADPKLNEARDKALAAALALLTDDQRSVWSDLVGKKFKGSPNAVVPPHPPTP